MKKKWISVLYKYKYEVLLIGLLQHIFVGGFLSDMDFYAKFFWPITMITLGVSTVGLFEGRGKTELTLSNILLTLVILLPLTSSLFEDKSLFMQAVSMIYTAYFGLLFYEVMRSLLRPGNVDASVLFASVCGFFLILEIFVFSLQYMYYKNPLSIKNIDNSSFASTFIDIVYYCIMVLTSIGFGDIVPTTHKTKLFTSLMGIIAQIYNVVLVGILISRFSHRLPNRSADE